MAKYTLIDPDVTKLTEVAFICHQMLFFEDLFKRYKDPKDEAESLRYKGILKSWLQNNLKKE